MTDKDQMQDSTGAAGGLARKLAASKEGTGGVGGSVTLKALRRSVARAAEDLCELPMAVLAARQTNRSPEDLGSLLSNKHLLIVLDCPEGRVGAATLDAAAVTALIQQQTMGAVLGMAGDERNYTPTDAAMVAEFLENLFTKVTSLLEEQADLAIFEGYRFGAQIEDVRTLVLGMEADDYRVINLNLDLAAGKMQGEMSLVLPEPSKEELGDVNAVRGPRLGSSVGSMRAELTAILCKMRIPLNEFSALKVGELVHLDQAYLYETDMVTISGRSVVKGRLGQMNGSRAVRMSVSGAPAQVSGGFSDGVGGDQPSLGFAADDGGLDLSVAAQGLQEPMDNLGGLGGDLGGGLGGDLGGGLGGGLDGGDLPMGDFPAGDLPELPMSDLGDFDTNDAAAEISELAGLESDFPETGT